MRFHIAAVALDGALWIETDIGLVRFDGKQWLADRNALKAATVAVAPDGSLWVGTYEGQVFHYEPTLVLVAPAAPLPTALRSSVTPPPLPFQPRVLRPALLDGERYHQRMTVPIESEFAVRAAKKKPGEWSPAILHASLISLFVLGLFYSWFVVADRYAIFLYEHLGALPFDEMTSSRYWMAGLVASGAVLVVYTTLNGVLGRVRMARGYSPPAWWRVWALCVAPLIAGILIITMTFNQPTLPLLNAAACAAATVIGLALALPPGAWAAQRPLDLIWLMLDGTGLMPVLLLLRAIELPGRGLASVPVACSVTVMSVVAGAVWLGVVTALRVWRRAASVGAMAVLVAGLCLSYLLMPLAHHLLFTPVGYRYITASANFFARRGDVQLLTLVMATSLAAGVTHLRRRLQRV